MIERLPTEILRQLTQSVLRSVMMEIDVSKLPQEQARRTLCVDEMRRIFHPPIRYYGWTSPAAHSPTSLRIASSCLAMVEDNARNIPTNGGRRALSVEEMRRDFHSPIGYFGPFRRRIPQPACASRPPVQEWWRALLGMYRPTEDAVHGA